MRLGKAIAAPKRIELLDILRQGPRTVESLADQTALSVANASQHLRVLRVARLVEAEKKGLYLEYRLTGDWVSGFLIDEKIVGGYRHWADPSALLNAGPMRRRCVTRETIEAIEHPLAPCNQRIIPIEQCVVTDNSRKLKRTEHAVIRI